MSSEVVVSRKIGLRETAIRPPLKAGEILMDFIEPVFISRVTLEGTKNLDTVRQFLSEGKHVVIVANHQSHADGPAIHVGLSRNGFADLAKRCVYVSGIKMDQMPATKILGRRVPTIPVWPPTIEPKNEAEEREKSGMLRQSLKALAECFQKKKIVVLFPEGGRSRNKGMRQAFGQVASYMRGAYVVPFGIVGTDKILGVGKLLPRRGDVSEIVGEPIDTDSYEETLGLPADRQRQQVVDHVMEAVAALLPESYRGYYAKQEVSH